MQEERSKRGPSREYSNGAITVYWEAQYCIHTAACLMGLPGVFDSGRRPWIDVNQAPTDDIAQVVMRCPTGALRFRRHDGGEQEAPPSDTSVQPRKNGPLFVRGAIRVVDTQGDVVREGKRVAFCRCGQSGNKPFCDGTHRTVRFEAE